MLLLQRRKNMEQQRWRVMRWMAVGQRAIMLKKTSLLRSKETHHMKNKPIKEDYKFFILGTKLGFIVNFTLDGQRAAAIGEQEYEHDRLIGKVESIMSTFVITIDNYFILPCVISRLCEMRIGIVGTAKYRGQIDHQNN
eukprot:15364683-Ditylum_brightwellii.AAC.1